MPTNAQLIDAINKIHTLNDIATQLRALGSTIPETAMHHYIMVQASRLDDIMVTMCSNLRRLCAEPYGGHK
jgi:hypothetical protein